MDNLFHFWLYRPNMSCAAARDESRGVKVVMSHGPTGWVGLVADNPHNPGVSATNGILRYMERAAHLHEMALLELSWLELDSMGRIDQVLVIDEAEQFQPWLAVVPFEQQMQKLLPLFGDHARSALEWALQP